VLTTLLDGRAFAERFGSGEPAVVAVHGWGSDRSEWTPVLAGLDVPGALAVDLPGFGATPPPATPWTTTEYADWLASILLDLDRPVLVGRSFGGRICVQLAAARPDLTRGVVLTGTPLYRSSAGTGKPQLGYRLAKSLYSNGLIGEERMERARQKYGSADYRAARGVMREVLVKAVNEAYDEQVEAMAAHGVPTRLVWGDSDETAPVWMAERAVEVLDTRPVVVSGAPHRLDGGLVPALRAAVAGAVGGAR
jgi:pimeloyl-ACP methyl ester carboxylesterase